MDPMTFMLSMVMMKMLGNELPHTIMYEMNRPDLVAKYGSWAVGRAEAVCPLNDAECVEKYAQSLQRKTLSKAGVL
jgi:hypothetical protein